MMKMVRSVFPMIGSHDQILRSSSSKGSCQLMHRMLSQNFPSEKLVKNYTEHLSQLQSVNEIRKQERRKEKQLRALKDVHCYDWKTLVEKWELDTLKVLELDKYIEYNKLSKNGKKIDKIKRITVHYYETSKESTFPSSVSVGEDSDESDSDNDLVLRDESESESESDDDSHTVTIQEGTSTRSGRRVGHWSTRYADFVQ